MERRGTILEVIDGSEDMFSVTSVSRSEGPLWRFTFECRAGKAGARPLGRRLMAMALDGLLWTLIWNQRGNASSQGG